MPQILLHAIEISTEITRHLFRASIKKGGRITKNSELSRGTSRVAGLTSTNIDVVDARKKNTLAIVVDNGHQQTVQSVLEGVGLLIFDMSTLKALQPSPSRNQHIPSIDE